MSLKKKTPEQLDRQHARKMTRGKITLYAIGVLAVLSLITNVSKLTKEKKAPNALELRAERADRALDSILVNVYGIPKGKAADHITVLGDLSDITPQISQLPQQARYDAQKSLLDLESDLMKTVPGRDSAHYRKLQRDLETARASLDSAIAVFDPTPVNCARRVMFEAGDTTYNGFQIMDLRTGKSVLDIIFKTGAGQVFPETDARQIKEALGTADTTGTADALKKPEEEMTK